MACHLCTPPLFVHDQCPLRTYNLQLDGLLCFAITLHSETPRPWLNLQSQCAFWAHCVGLTCCPILAMQLQGKRVCAISNTFITIGSNWLYLSWRYKTGPQDEGALHDSVSIDALVSNDAYLTHLQMLECVQSVKTPCKHQASVGNVNVWI